MAYYIIDLTKELALELAGGDSYIRTKNGEVKGLAITTDKNPEAPDVIVVGNGPRIVANARLFLEAQTFVPIYVKQTVNEWKYLGHYKADKYAQDSATIKKHRRHRSAEGIDGILFLSAKDDLEVTISHRSGHDIETKKKVEIAAIDYVISYYESLNYSVTDRQKDNCGYDLLAEKNSDVFKIEVKGTSVKEQRFFLSRNERAKSVDPLWRLAIVKDALVSPMLEIFNMDKMEEVFDFDALCWECTKP